MLSSTRSRPNYRARFAPPRCSTQAATGTPLHNSMADAFALLRFVRAKPYGFDGKGLLGVDYDAFGVFDTIFESFYGNINISWRADPKTPNAS